MISGLYEIIEAYCQEQGLSIYDFADKCGVAPSTIYRINRGYDTTIETLEKIGAGMGYPNVHIAFTKSEENLQDRIEISEDSHVILKRYFQDALAVSQQFSLVCQMMIDRLPPIKQEDEATE